MKTSTLAIGVAVIAVLLTLTGCGTPYSPDAFPDWTVTDDGGVRYATRSVEVNGSFVTLRIAASPAAIDKMLNGRLGVSYYSPDADEVIVLLERDTSIETPADGEAEVVKVSVEVVNARATQISGNGLNNGAWVQWEQIAVFGCSCDIETITGNADLELRRKKANGTWVLEDSSYNPGTSPDNVECATWFSTYRVRVLSAADGTAFMGTIYW